MKFGSQIPGNQTTWEEMRAVAQTMDQGRWDSAWTFDHFVPPLAFMDESGIPITSVYWPLEGKSPNALDLIQSGKVDLVVNIPKDASAEELTNDYKIRRAAVDHGVPLITNIQLAQRLAQALLRKSLDSLEIRSWGEY